MIRIAAAARRALARLTRAPGRHTQHDDEWDDATFAILRGQPATIPRADVAGAPPWNPAAGWAGGVAPDPETARLVWEAECGPIGPPNWLPQPVLIEGNLAWPASGSGPVTVAEPLAPLPPEPKPGPRPVTASASYAKPRCASPSPLPPATTPDALTLLDERQQLIDHAAAVIAAAKFDRILGGVMADA